MEIFAWNQMGPSRLYCNGRAAMEAVMADQWIHPDRAVDKPRDTGEDAAYAAGWTISGIATLATIVAVWVFAI
jgi:hypothetical protein